MDGDGKVVQYKARLVPKGFSQVYGADYDEVFAPVAKQTTFRTLLSIAATRKLIVKHVDVKEFSKTIKIEKVYCFLHYFRPKQSNQAQHEL